MPEILKIKKGIDLRLQGGVEGIGRVVVPNVGRIALTPDDFPGMTPKLDVKPGDTVGAGDPLWHDKSDASIRVVSPVDGKVADVVRGEKRRVLRVVVDVKGSTGTRLDPTVPIADPEIIKSCIKSAGLWACMRQLPYDIVPVDNRAPVNIFISAWDSAPLASGFSAYLSDDSNKDFLLKGIEALGLLTTGQIFVGFRKGEAFDIAGARCVEIDGPYPASLPSVLAANTVPVNKGQTVWLMSVENAVRIGQAVSGKHVDWTFPLALVGSELESPCLVKAPAGASLDAILPSGHVKTDARHRRYISGNVFVGQKVEPEGYMRYPYRQLTVIPEGDDKTEFMGWASISPNKMSNSRSFPGFFFRKRRYSPDARLNGGRRSMIMSGEYDRYIPMDIMAEYLLKAIIARNIERMEALGIYEVTPGDFSAAEYADTSKLELQKIVRQGLDYMIKEVGTGD